jgi:fumarate reductase iron-sulfur subunit
MNKIKVCDKEYPLKNNNTNLLDTLIDIKENQNANLAFKYSCKSGVCGSCSVRVNGVEKLACDCNISVDDDIQALKNVPVIRDLIVDDNNIKSRLYQSNAFLDTNNNPSISNSDVEKIDIQSNCILCNSCYSSCPIYEVNENFIGPFALTRVYRYVEDKKENNSIDKLDAIQNDGIWDCTLCGACSAVCPQSIDIKNDIMLLQNISVQKGYENPAFSSTNSLSSFDSGDFGFNPNGF